MIININNNKLYKNIFIKTIHTYIISKYNINKDIVDRLNYHNLSLASE